MAVSDFVCGPGRYGIKICLTSGNAALAFEFRDATKYQVDDRENEDDTEDSPKESQLRFDRLRRWLDVSRREGDALAEILGDTRAVRCGRIEFLGSCLARNQKP